MPAPVSPWKYSWNSSRSRHSGSSRSFAIAPATGRWPSASGSQIETRRAARSAATSRRRIRRPEPVGYSTVNVLAQRLVPAQQRLDEQVVDREPDRAAPVRVAAEQVRRRLARLVVDRRGDALDLDLERLVEVAPRQRAQPVRRQERVLGQHLAEDPLELDRRQQAEDHLVAAGRVDDRAARAGALVGDARRWPGSGRSACPALRPAPGLARDRDARQHRQQPDHRVDLERDRGAVGQPERVVVEAVRPRPTGRSG